VANVTIEGIKRMVAEGVGVGFVPLMCVLEEKARGELVTIKVNGISRERELSLLHRGDALAPAARAFLAVCLKVARESSQVKTRPQKSLVRATKQETSFSGKNTAARSHC
jgi:DNA-binding transcriptional LysR family regulator